MCLRNRQLKGLLVAIITVFFGDLLFSRCANPISPSGGPKDTIPPNLITADPEIGSIQFDQQTMRLTFSEFINVDKLTQNLIITPKTDIRFKHIVRKNRLDLKFETPFPDSTTFSLNFFDGVTDITEKNPAINLVIAFSTGDFIDSMKVSGYVKDLMTGEPSKSFLVGLYPVSDSLDFLSESPTYFTTANDSGRFSMSYIEAGNYKILSFIDDNRNLLLDPKEEDHGFLSDTIKLIEPLDSIIIHTFLQNVKPIEIINNRPIRSHHEIKFNRDIDKYEISPDSIYSSIQGEDLDIIRLYNPNQFQYGDTTSIQISVYDSLSNVVNDTLKIVFNESSVKLTELTASIEYHPKILVNDPLYKIIFNKPIRDTDISKFAYQTDSTFTFYPDSIGMAWNNNLTELKLQTFLKKDSIYNSQKRETQIDSAMYKIYKIDSLQEIIPNYLDSIKQILASKSPIEFRVLEGAFISVESDTSEIQKISHKRDVKESFGTLKLKLFTEKTSFRVQLIDSKKKVAYEAINNPNPSFDVKPSKYSIRILIDSNNDGQWTFGNLLKNIEPEEVYVFPEEISIRENWIVEDINITF